MTSDVPTPDADAVAAAVAALRRGEAVGLPTETVYGLAADAGNPEAVRRVFALKGRPADHPLIVHLPGIEALDAWAREVPEAARALAARYWPGPLTLILRRAAHVSDAVTGGQDTVGLRVPAHPTAQAVLRAFGGGLAAPSANRFGRISPTTAAHVRAEFGNAVPVVLDGGPCAVGIESTIVDCSGMRPRILRPGMLDRAAIEAVIGPLDDAPTRDAPRAPGMLAAHYAPRTPLRILPRAMLEARVAQAREHGETVRVLALDALPAGAAGLALPREPGAYAHDLYAALRALDAAAATQLLAEAVPEDERWRAIADRLRRAAAGTPSPP